MDNFQTVLRFFMNQKATIGYSFMALLTIGGERVFSMVSFQCPCNHDQNFAYGLTFLLGPAAVLLVLGLFFSSRLWRLYTGCCLNPMKLCPRGNCSGCLRVFMSIFTGACVAPVMWLCVALLNGTFYECAVSGLDDNLVVDLFCKNKTLKCREELARVPCDRSRLTSDERMELLLMFRAQSQCSSLKCVCRSWAGVSSLLLPWGASWVPAAQTVAPKSASCNSHSGNAMWRKRRSTLRPSLRNTQTSWPRETCRASLRTKTLLHSLSPITSHGRRSLDSTPSPRVSSITAPCSATWRGQTGTSRQKRDLCWT
ncbi:calcium homeostasis modulator protein 5-like isoform X1 [Cottoperca gobio]|uniref:Calcium homeostasis modulator protein 5-like isoform X1 n=1 Tax=Cottoperca gobio TaxID=56716 RepID=A0A6J2RBZ1_COTGO|nr:calcium homeostasis modulator protein 5-like isoform X1 [Cottoperca gobio]